MNIEVYKNSEGKLVVDTLSIANVYGKEHKNVLRDFDEMLTKLDAEWSRDDSSKLSARISYSDDYLYLIKSAYLTSQGKPMVKYEVNEAMFNMVVLAYTGINAVVHRLDFIKAFIDMRNGKPEPVGTDTRNWSQRSRFMWEWNGQTFNSGSQLAKYLGVPTNYPAMYASQGSKLKGYHVIKTEVK